MDYSVSGPHFIPTMPKGRMLDFSEDAKKRFWEEAQEKAGWNVEEANGCYIYANKVSKGFTPWYVGQAKNTFGKETFSDRNCNNYNKHYATTERGRPLVIFVIRRTPTGRIAKLQEGEANWVEDYLIRRALDKNPRLLNKQNTKFFTNVKMPGVHNANAKTEDDRVLAEALGISKPYGFTTQTGKFHQ